MSIKYSTPSLNFLKVDIDVNPHIAAKYKIQTSGFSVQLPVLVMFKNGQPTEEGRYPSVDSKGKSYQVKYYSEQKLTKLFDLEKLYLTTSIIKTNLHK